MSLRDWVGNTTTRVREDGLSGVAESGRRLYTGFWRVAGSRLPLGTNIYDREWDVLVLLDGCRVDLLSEMAPEYPYLLPVDSIRSVGSSSREWLAKTFVAAHADKVGRTVYVTANPYTEEILSPGGATNNRSPFNPANWSSLNAAEFERVEEVWQDGWDDSLGTVPPRRVTDRAITVARNESPERLIVHYMQPHQPFVETVADDQPDWTRGNCWRAIQRGDVSKNTVWAAYGRNLRLAMEEVSLLRQSIDAARLVVSSDHGNAFGEWGIYGHPNGSLHPAVKHVPWAVTNAADTGEYDPDVERESSEASVEERLDGLGYL
jgi:hypothetical protein